MSNVTVPGSLDFDGRVALVTGAASGIGRATAKWLDAHKVGQLILVDINGDALEQDIFACQTSRYQGDVGDPALWDRIGNEISRIDHAFLNAGIAPVGRAIVDLTLDDWKSVMHVNLDGVFLGLRTVLRPMINQRSGSIVITSSVAGIKALKGTGDYAAAKAGVAHLAKVAAAENAEFGIRVNAIAPGGVDTGIWDAQAAFLAAVAGNAGDRAGVIAALGAGDTPRGRWATPDELAANVGFLLSDLASNVTGTVLVSDGGYTM